MQNLKEIVEGYSPLTDEQLEKSMRTLAEAARDEDKFNKILIEENFTLMEAFKFGATCASAYHVLELRKAFKEKEEQQKK